MVNYKPWHWPSVIEYSCFRREKGDFKEWVFTHTHTHSKERERETKRDIAILAVTRINSKLSLR